MRVLKEARDAIIRGRVIREKTMEILTMAENELRERVRIFACEWRKNHPNRPDQNMADRMEEMSADFAAIIQQEQMEKDAKIAESEPVLPGPMPLQLRSAFESDLETTCRAVCSSTKRSIAAAIRRSLQEKGLER